MQDLINKKGSLPVAQAVEIAIGILDGLAHLHNRKIIHRDLKPDNVLFQGVTPRLTDFGISRAMQVDSQSITISGTRRYMSPEALDGKRNAQTDTWSVGVILYQLLSETFPFPQRDETALIKAIIMDEPVPLPDSVPAVLRCIVQRSLAKEASARYQTADEMSKELKDFRTAHSSLFPPLPTEPSILVNNAETIPFNNFVSPNGPAQSNEIETIVTPPKPKSKMNPLYFAAPAVLMLILAIIGGSYWLSGRASNSNKNTSVVTPSKPVADINLIPFRKGDKWGFSDENKNIVVEPKYDDAQPFSDGLAKVTLSASGLNRSYGFIDKTGNEVIPLIYGKKYSSGKDLGLDFNEEVLDKFTDDVIAVKLADGKYVFINKMGKEITSLKYDDVLPFNEGLAGVKLNGKYGFVDSTGKEKIPIKYDEVGSFKDGLAPVLLKIDGESTGEIIDKSGNVALSFFSTDLPKYSNGLTLKYVEDKWAFMDRTGSIVVTAENRYNAIFPFWSEGMLPVQSNGKWGFINMSGKEVIAPRYDSVSHFSEGLASVTEGKGESAKEGFINKSGEVVIPLQFKQVYYFKEGLAYVEVGKNIGFIDNKGNIKVELKYEYAESFNQGLARVKRNDKEFYIDKNGTEYYEP